jgi:chromosome partitioning protein
MVNPVRQWVDDRVGSVDLVVIDAPPHAETEARIAVRAARLVVVPVQPSPLDLWATAETLKMAQDERRRSLVVLNRVPPRSRLTECRGRAGHFIGLPNRECAR